MFAIVPDVRFTFAGNKEVDNLSNLISDRGLNGSAEVVGWIEGQAKIDLMKSSSVLVLPSYTEGVPNVILEAMANRLPIVTTPVGGIPSVLEHDRTAIFVEPKNIQSISEGLIALLTDRQKSRTLADAAFERASKLYSIEAIGDGLTQIYDQYRNKKKI
jgi:glycosyltransferase involved in cell wall biosynthesis